MNKLTTKVSNNMKSSFGKIGKVLSFTAITVGLTKLGKKVLNAASDLQEVQNVVDVAFGDASKEIDKFAKNAITQFGLSEYAAKNMAATFMAIGESMNIDPSKAKTMSVQLTGLAADLASFYNTDVEEAYNALQAIYTGMIRPLRKYGVNLSEAALQQYALEKGIKKSVSAMNQAEKATLRYNYVLDATRLAQNDFIQTHTSWHNALQQINSQLNVLASTMGTILMKALTPVVNALAQVVNYAIKAAQALAALFGVELQFSSGRSAESISSGWEEADEAIQDATGSAKKYKKLIDGFDELNIMTSTGGGSGADETDFGSGGFEVGKYFDITATEMKKVDFNTMVGKLDETINKYRGKLEYLGQLIGEKINNMFNYVDWQLLGKTLMDGLNTVFSSINKYFNTTDFLNIGSKLGTMFNSSLQTIEPATLGQILINKFNAAFQTLYGFVTTLDWGLLKDRISAVISNAIQKLDMATIKKAISTTAQNVMALIKGLDFYQIGHTIGEALSGVNWVQVFITVKQAIWEGFKGFWDGLMSDGKNLILGSLGKISSFFKKSVPGILIAALGGLFASLFKFISTNIFTVGVIATKLASKALGSTSEGVAKVVADKSLIGKVGIIWRSIPKVIGDGLGRVGALFNNVGVNIINTLEHPIMTAQMMFGGLKDKILGFGSSIKTGVSTALSTVTGGIKTFIADPIGSLKGALAGIKSGFQNLWGIIKAHPMAVGIAAIAALVASFIDAWKHSDELREHVESIWNTIKDFGKFLFDGVKKLWDEYIKPAWDDIKAALRDIQDNVLIPLWNTISGIIDWVVKLINNTLKPVISALLPYIGNIIKSVMGVISGIITFLSGVFSGDWSKAWSGIVKIFDSIWSTLKTIAVAPLNGIIFLVNKLLSLLQKGLNWIVDKVNAFGIHKDTIFGRVDIGFNLPHVNLGQLGYIQLAKGGVIDETTMAMMGEYPGAKHNPEIVSPTNLMREVFMESNEEMVDVMIQIGRQVVEAINNNETTITIGDDVISAAAARGAKNFKKMTGRNQFAI